MPAFSNWRGRSNPFGLLAPPDWWLRKLWERDRDLVILPGLSECCYRVGRKSALMKRVRPILGNDSETGRMCRERLIPVVSLRPDCTWNEDFFLWLDRHDTWKVGGPEKFADALDEQDRRERAAIDRQVDDNVDQLARTTYFAACVRNGAVAFLKDAQPQAVGLSVDGDGPRTGDLSNGSLP